MRTLRPATSLVVALAVFVPTPRVAQAQETPQAPPAAEAHWHEPDGSVAAPTTAPAPPPSSPTWARPFALGPSSPSVFVHVDADPAIELEGWLSDGRGWRFACRAPCDRELPLDADYVFKPPGSRRSVMFNLEGSPGQRVSIAVVPGSPDATGQGAALVVVGALAAAGGLVASVYGALAGSYGCGDTDPPTCPNVAGVEAGALAAVLSGTGLIVAGVLVIHYKGRTELKQTVSDLIVPRPPERPDTAWLRTPIWVDALREGSPGATRAAVPVFSRTF